MHNDTTNPESRNSAEVTLGHAVFRGLSPRSAVFEQTCDSAAGQIRKTLMGSLPLLMTGSLATGVIASPGSALEASNVEGLAQMGSEREDIRPGIAERLQASIFPVARAILSQTHPDLPATYTVQAGDSVSSIADRFGIPTPAILTLNGLSWTTVLQQGQVLKLSAEPTKKRASSPARVTQQGYIVQYGDSVSAIAGKLGISTTALLTHNNLESNAGIYPGQFLKVPGSTVPTVSRDIPSIIPTVTGAPRITLAGVSAASSSEQEQGTPGSETLSHDEFFDAADIPLAQKPTLITVKNNQQTPQAPARSTPAAAPNPSPPASSAGQPVTGTITPLSKERRKNARIIVSVGRELGVPDYGIVIALATAMQESSLRNISWGDRDSVGLFQQRPSSGWGTSEQILDPAYSARLFFGGPANPNKGRTRGLLDIAGWQKMTLTEAAQRVQISAFPGAYAKWEPSAWAWLYDLS